MTRPFDQTQVVEGREVRSNGEQTLQVFAEEGGRTFMRRGIKAAGTPDARPVEWVVGELDGVRAYFDGTHVILTRKDVNP